MDIPGSLRVHIIEGRNLDAKGSLFSRLCAIELEFNLQFLSI
jgi:hypothetical protein